MLSSGEIERLSMAFDAPMRNLENAVMEDIVRRIKINSEITRSADWQINRLYSSGVSKREIKKLIVENLHISKAEINHLYKDVIRKGYAHDNALYRYKGNAALSLENNPYMTRLIQSVAEQTYTAMSNISQSLGFAVKNGSGKLEFTPLADYFQRTVDGAILGIEGGFFDYNTVIKRVISEMTNSGLRTVDYATGWSNRVDVAARRAVMTGYNQLVAKTNEHNAEQLGTEYFEVTWHSGARPSHQEWQGRVFSKSELVSKCGLGTVEGLCGANCYHNYYPFIPGVSQRTYTDEQLEQMNAEENQKREYLGRKYTKYEALQRQRQLETRMRAQRQQIKLLQDGGANEDDIINARCRYRGTSQEYTHFSRAMGLPQQRQRVTADGLGNIGAGKFTGGSGKESPMDVPKVGAVRRDKVTPAEREELLKNSGKVLTNGSGSGIIEESQGKKPITSITDKAIDRVPFVEVQGYSPEQCKFIQQQHRELLKYSRDNNDNKEVAFVFRKDLSDKSIFTGSDDSLNFGNMLFGVGNDLFVMHNHPRNGGFSNRDIIFLLNNDVKTLTIVKNNGGVEILSKTENFNLVDAKIALNRAVKKHIKNNTNAEIDRAIAEFLKKYREGLEWIKM